MGIVLLLGALALLAAGSWYAASLLNDPLVASGGGAKTEGYSHLSSLYGKGPDRLNRPTEVTVDAKGNIYVADSFKHRIVVFDSSGVFVRTIGSPANVDGALKFPSSVRVDDRGRVYVTSSEPGKVVIFGADGSVIRSVDVPEPLTLAIADDRLYVATASGILIGDLDGNQIGQLSERGKEPGMIDRPTGIAVDDDGTIYIADSLNYRFQAIDAKGEVKWSTGAGPDPAKAVVDRDRTYGLPSSITIGSDDLLYAIDAFNGMIVVLNKDGEHLAEYGQWGRQDGQFYYPTGIAQVSPERFVIADTFNDRLQFVGVPSLNPGVGTLANRSWPWAVPALLLLGLLVLARRPAAVVAEAEGLRVAHERELLEDLIRESKTIFVPAGTAEAIADLLDSHDGLAESLREVDLGDLADGVRPGLELALRLKGRFAIRRVALAFPDGELAELARDSGLGVLDDGTPVAAVGVAGSGLS